MEDSSKLTSRQSLYPANHARNGTRQEEKEHSPEKNTEKRTKEQKISFARTGMIKEMV